MAGTKQKVPPRRRDVPEAQALQAVVAGGRGSGRVRADGRVGARVQRRERIDLSQAGQLFVNVPLEDLQWFRHRAVLGKADARSDRRRHGESTAASMTGVVLGGTALVPRPADALTESAPDPRPALVYLGRLGTTRSRRTMAGVLDRLEILRAIIQRHGQRGLRRVQAFDRGGRGKGLEALHERSRHGSLG